MTPLDNAPPGERRVIWWRIIFAVLLGATLATVVMLGGTARQTQRAILRGSAVSDTLRALAVRQIALAESTTVLAREARAAALAAAEAQLVATENVQVILRNLAYRARANRKFQRALVDSATSTIVSKVDTVRAVADSVQDALTPPPRRR